MTLDDAKQIMTVMLKENDRSGLSLLPDEKDALNTALDYMNEGPPGRVVHELSLDGTSATRYTAAGKPSNCEKTTEDSRQAT